MIIVNNDVNDGEGNDNDDDNDNNDDGDDQGQRVGDNGRLWVDHGWVGSCLYSCNSHQVRQ